MRQFGGERLAVAGRYRLQFRGDWPLVVGDAWISEPREWQFCLKWCTRRGRLLDGSEPSRCMAKDVGRPR